MKYLSLFSCAVLALSVSACAITTSVDSQNGKHKAVTTLSDFFGPKIVIQSECSTVESVTGSNGKTETTYSGCQVQ